MVKTYGPCFRFRERALDGSNVVRLAIVIPSKNLDNVVLVTILEDGFPTFGQEMLVSEIGELEQENGSSKRKPRKPTTHVFVKGILSIMGEKVGRDSTHVGWFGGS